MTARLLLCTALSLGTTSLRADKCDESYSDAVFFQNNGSPELAWERWQKVIAVCKDAQRVRKAKLFSGACLYQLKKYQEAAAQLEALPEKEWSQEATKPADIHLRRAAILLLAASHLRLKKEHAAAILLTAFEKEFPDHRKEVEAVRSGSPPPYGKIPEVIPSVAPAPGQ